MEGGRPGHYRIQVTTRKGLKVRSRKGFSDFSRATEASLSAQGILLLGGNPKDKRPIVEAVAPAGKGATFDVPVTVVIPLSELTPLQEGDHWMVMAVLSLGAWARPDLLRISPRSRWARSCREA